MAPASPPLGGEMIKSFVWVGVWARPILSSWLSLCFIKSFRVAFR